MYVYDPMEKRKTQLLNVQEGANVAGVVGTIFHIGMATGRLPLTFTKRFKTLISLNSCVSHSRTRLPNDRNLAPFFNIGLSTEVGGESNRRSVSFRFVRTFLHARGLLGCPIGQVLANACAG